MLERAVDQALVSGSYSSFLVRAVAPALMVPPSTNILPAAAAAARSARAVGRLGRVAQMLTEGSYISAAA